MVFSYPKYFQKILIFYWIADPKISLCIRNITFRLQLFCGNMFWENICAVWLQLNFGDYFMTFGVYLNIFISTVGLNVWTCKDFSLFPIYSLIWRKLHKRQLLLLLEKQKFLFVLWTKLRIVLHENSLILPSNELPLFIPIFISPFLPSVISIFQNSICISNPVLFKYFFLIN